MGNAKKNITFLNTIDNEAKTAILENIAKHYQISTDDAYKEVTDDEAEHLLEYITGAERTATHVLMQKHKCI